MHRRDRRATIALIAALACASLAAEPARAQTLNLPPGTKQALEKMYNGDPDAAIVIAQEMQNAAPDHPVSFLLEAEARWWKMYCGACEIKWGMVDAWKQPKSETDEKYFELADHAIRLAEAHILKADSAEMHLYAGMGWALKARLHGLRDERRATARTGVNAREQFLLALKLDPSLADAYTGLGLYNYYVDTLSPFVKFLRVFMGIPGGNKEEGMRQLERGMKEGELTSVDARFYYAKNLRTYDQRYETALSIATPLVEHYPNNPLFHLLVGNLSQALGRHEEATSNFRAAQNLSIADSACAARVRQVASAFLASSH